MAHGLNSTGEGRSRKDAHTAIEQVVAAYATSPELLDEIFEIFTEDAPERLAALQHAAETGDYAAAQRAAHSLANMTGTLRCDRALEAAREAEIAARAEESDALAYPAAVLAATVHEMLSAIESYQNRTAAGGS